MDTDSPGLPETEPVVPEHETPAYRLAEHSADYLSDTELLSLILKGAMGTERSIETARQLMVSCGSIQRLAGLSLTELRRVPGIGLAGACAVQSALALAARLYRPDQYGRIPLTNARDVVQYMYGRLVSRLQEEFHVLLLDTKHNLICSRMITRGLLDRIQIHPREVFREAIAASCARVILAHNHPLCPAVHNGCYA